jgi:hypothetical protein
MYSTTVHVATTSVPDIEKVARNLGLTITDKRNRAGSCGYTTLTIERKG